MSATLVDQDARTRVTERFNESLLVEAGAGTGKTTALVDRVANGLRMGEMTIDDLAVVTFTKDAAAELAGRVRERLEEVLAESPPTEERSRLENALRNLYRARISTLHVFATTLLRERPVEGRVDPGLRTLNEVERQQRFADVYAAWLDEVLAGDDVHIALALNRGMKLEHLEALCRGIDAHRHALPLDPVVVPRVDHRSFRIAIAAHTDALGRLQPRCVDPEDKGILQWPGVQRFSEAVRGAEDDLTLERVALERAPRINAHAGRQGSWEDSADCKAWKAELADLRDTIERFCDELRATALAGIVPLAERFVRHFEEERRTAGVADFDDLLLWARNLLRDDAAARRWFRDRYRHVLIDEFQDTDPLQAELALLLTSPGPSNDWTVLTPDPGALVVVGDPKQSIYRFRRGDIQTYDAVKSGPLAGERVELRQNFRSVGGLLHWCNAVFASLFGAGDPGRQAPHVPLEPTASDRVGDRAPVIVVPDPVRAGKLKADALRDREADLLARTISLAVGEGWPVRDGGDVRAATYGDVAVIIPARTGLDAIIDAFDRFGIPYRADRGIGLFQQPEVMELVAILRAIDDPGDAVSVVGALRSDAFGCSADDLVAYAAVADGRFDPRWIVDDGPAVVVEGLQTLADWRRQRRGLSLAELVDRVVSGSGLVELALEGRGGPQAAGNVLEVVEEARAFAASGGGLRAFARWLSEQREVDTEAAEAPVADPSDPVVRIMTAHGSKGLEFPIVALAGLDARAKNQAPDAIARRGRVEVQVASGWQTPGYAAFADDEKALLSRERERLLYVATTRARDHLVLPAVHAKDDRQHHLAALGPWLPDDDAAMYDKEDGGVHVLDPRSLPIEPETTVAGDADAPEVALEHLIDDESAWVVRRRSAREAAAAGLVQTVASTVQPIDRIRPLAAADGSGDAANDEADVESTPPLPLGTALHLVMDRIALDGSQDPRPLVEASCLECGIVGAEAELERLVRNCLASPAVAQAAAARDVARELPFALDVPSVGYAVGRVDLAFVDEGELVVVDYKSDKVGDSDAALAAASAAHSGQGAVYAVALERATGLRVREVVWVYARVGREHRLVVDDSVHSAAEALMREGVVLGADET